MSNFCLKEVTYFNRACQMAQDGYGGRGMMILNIWMLVERAEVRSQHRIIHPGISRHGDVRRRSHIVIGMCCRRPMNIPFI